MSTSRPVIGLGDSSFDPDLHTSVDHDFFDNPTSAAMMDISKPPTVLILSSVEREEDLLIEAIGKKVSKDESLVGIRVGLDNSSSPQVESEAEPSNAELAAAAINTTTTTTTINIISPSQSQQQIFSTGKLLACLTHPELSIKVDFPPNPTGMWNGRSEPGENGERIEEYHVNPDFSNNLLTHSDVTCQQLLQYQTQYQQQQQQQQQQHHTNNASKKFKSKRTPVAIKLFDISSSSSDSDSDSGSDIISTETDDENFVHMLGRYCDCIDLGDSDFSDITEVSPMSSLNASPLPPNFLGSDDSNSNPPTLDHSSTTTLNIPGSGHHLHQQHLLQQQQQSTLSSPHMQVVKPKPILPLVISTTEEIIIPIMGNNSNSCNRDDHHCHNKHPNHELEASFHHNLHHHSHNLILEQHINGNDTRSPSCSSSNNSNSVMPVATCSSSLATSSFAMSMEATESSSSSSMRSSGSSASGSASASSSVSSSGSASGGGNSRRHGKNHTFTPDQVKRIERENNILLRKIMDTQKPHHGHGHFHHHGHSHMKGLHKTNGYRAMQSSSSIARLRQQKRIEHENNILMKRLQSVKPSKEIGEAFKPANN